MSAATFPAFPRCLLVACAVAVLSRCGGEAVTSEDASVPSGESGAGGDAGTSGDGGVPDADASAEADASDSDACGDLQVDPQNCGACAHSCKGGACKAGVCGPEPTVLAVDDGFPEAIAVDESYVYWATHDGAVKKVAISGGTITTLAQGTGKGSAYGVSSLAVDATDAYFSIDHSLMVVSLQGGGATEIAHDAIELMIFALDVSNVYWFKEELGWSIVKTPKAGGADIGLVNVFPITIAVFGDTLYWSTPSGTSGPGWGPGVFTMPTSGGDKKEICPLKYDSFYRPTNLVIDGSGVYWTDEGGKPPGKYGDPEPDPVVAHCAGSSSGAATVLAHMSAARLALDDQFVYYVAGKEIGRIPKSGSPPEVVAWGAYPKDIAVDATSLYFCDDDGIKKLPK
jgi:hypothetical protein